MDPRTTSVDNDIYISIGIGPCRLPWANLDFSLVQCAELDRAEGEEVD